MKRRHIVLISILVMGLVAVSGCTSKEPEGDKNNKEISQEANLEGISQNPKKYVGEEVQIQAELTMPVKLDPQARDWKYYLEDEQGYKFPLKVPPEKHRDYYAGEKYRVTGNIAERNYCTCQKKYTKVGEVTNYSKKYYRLKDFECEDNPLTGWGLIDKWRDTSHTDQELYSSCQTKENKTYSCTFDYYVNGDMDKTTTVEENFKEVYRCKPGSIESFYYLNSSEMKKI